MQGWKRQLAMLFTLFTLFCEVISLKLGDTLTVLPRNEFNLKLLFRFPVFIDYTALVRIFLRLKGCFYYKLFFGIC